MRSIGREAFDGDDPPVGRERPDWGDAGARRRSVDMDGAGTALGDAAAVLRARQPQLLADDPEERRIWIDIDLPHGPIHCQASHGSLSDSARSDLADATRRGGSIRAYASARADATGCKGRVGCSFDALEAAGSTSSAAWFKKCNF